MFQTLAQQDPVLYKSMQKELERQQNNIELIASENFASTATMEATGSYLTNKYAEGYPDHRYYGGCKFIDEVENLAISRAKELFNAEYANVQPHSGAQANMSVFFSVLQPGDTVLGLSLAHGGHLSHGSPVNMSGKWFNVIPYSVDDQTGLIDYDSLLTLAKQHTPKMIIAGASAYPRTIDFRKFREIADAVGAYLMVDMAHIAGLVAVGLHESPMPYADFVTSTTHKTLRGPRGGLIFCKEQYGKQVDKAVFPGVQGGPLMHVIAAKANCFREALMPEFKTYQTQVIKNAKELENAFNAQGMSMVTGGTDNHLLLLDLTETGITGKALETALDEINITVNKNAIPNDPNPPSVTSGIRIGTPAVTTKGMKEREMRIIAELITTIARNIDSPSVKENAKMQVKALVESVSLAKA
ncbi:MAG: serine hydroxymethyltransferase [Clostridiales bacterium]|jgi:glycine hydroxymethyltransferase|nr:serine hydroxymethyltransferase [Clostridiales bacterium]